MYVNDKNGVLIQALHASTKAGANRLKKRFKRIVIEKNNQKIVDKSKWVFLAITPAVGKKIIKGVESKVYKEASRYLKHKERNELNRQWKSANKNKYRIL